MPPSLWGGFRFSGGGGVFACASPQSDMRRACRGVFWGSPYQRKAAYFCRAPIGRFSTPPLGGVFIFCGLWLGGGAYLCGMEKRNRGGCPVVSAKYAVNGEGVGFLLAFALAPLRVQLAVLSEFLQGCEVWLMLWPLLWA
jgi:hypothetical protein